MKKIIIILLTTVLAISIIESNGQSISQGCQTEPVDSTTFFNWPYFGNNQYLLNLVDSLEGSPTSRVIPTTLRIPVTAWVYHINNPADNITNNVVEQYINAENQFLINSNSRIRLYLRCNINHITDNRFYDNISGSNNNTMFDSYYTPRTFNIHFTNNTADGFARGRFPWKSNPYVCFIPTRWSAFGNIMLAPLANTLAHEIGHGLGLLHTHEGSRGNKDNNGECGNCYQESVSRTMTQSVGCISTMGKKKCEVNGDCLCDTDADPLLFIQATSTTYVLPGCAGYDRTSPYQQDKWGAQWLPAGNDNAIRNVMSYSFANCRTEMTPMQRGVEYFYAVNKGAFPFGFQFESFYRNEEVDDFENDNFFQNANNITLNTVQEHSFHLVPDQNSVFNGCDVDWVRFVAPCNLTLSISTAAIPAYLNATANTRLTLFAANATTQLAQNDNISATNFFSSITWNFVAGQTYFIRVENMTPNFTGYYQLSISPNSTINGNDNLCTVPNTYNITNLPVGATVAWSTTPANLTTPSTGAGVTFTTSRVGTLNGNVTLTANISTPGCGLLQTAIKTLSVGSVSTAFYASYQVGSAYPITATGINYVSPFQPVTLTLNSSIPGITFTIEKVYGNSLVSTSANTALFSLPEYRTYNPAIGLITLLGKANAACSNMTTQAYNFSTQGKCGGCGTLFRVSPNPATDAIKIEELDASTGLLKTTNNTITAIELTDKMGNIVFTKNFNSKLASSSISIPVSQFKNDVYTIRIFNGTVWEVQQIIIQR